MIMANLPLVGYLVSKVIAGATHLSRDDLAQAGSVALIQAVDAYDAARGIPFGAYARERIIGAIKDEMRGNDWAKRAARKTIKTTLAVQELLTAQLGRTPSVDELAGALGVDRATAAEGLSFSTRTISSLDGTAAEFLEADIAPPGADLLVTERLAYLKAGLESLPERMSYILNAIYFDERLVGDVAAELGVTHSAISQQRAEAVRLLRDGLDHYYPDGDGVVLGGRTSAPGSRRTTYLADLAARVPAVVQASAAIAI